MLRNLKAPSLKKGNGVAAASAVSRGPSPVPFTDVAARLGFKRRQSKPEYDFDFQEPLPNGKAATLMQRRAMMSRTAATVYNQMGLAVRSHEVSRSALLWLNQLTESLSSDEERRVSDRLARRLGDIVEELYHIRRDKIERADKLENALTATKRKMRTAKVKQAVLESNVEGMERPERSNSYWPEEDHPETAKPSIALDPELVLQQKVQEEIKGKEKKAKSSKKSKNKAVTKLPEEETL